MAELSKALKREMRLLVETGYERSLDAELKELDVHFAAWKAGTMSPFELSEKIHVYHNGPARELYSRFTTRSLDDVIVAALFVDGVLGEFEISTELREALAGQVELIKLYRSEEE